MELGPPSVEPFYRSMELWLESGISFVAERTFFPGVSEPDVARRLRPFVTLVHVHCRSTHSSQRWELRMRRDPLCGENRLRGHLRPLVDRLDEELYEPLDFGCPALLVDTDNGYRPSLRSRRRDRFPLQQATGARPRSGAAAVGGPMNSGARRRPQVEVAPWRPNAFVARWVPAPEATAPSVLLAGTVAVPGVDAALNGQPAFTTFQAPGGAATAGQRVIALTFDDGPGPFTPQVLSVLQRFQVPATFFEIGEQVARYPQYSKMVAAAGFPVEDHTWSHPDLTTLPTRGSTPRST